MKRILSLLIFICALFCLTGCMPRVPLPLPSPTSHSPTQNLPNPTTPAPSPTNEPAPEVPTPEASVATPAISALPTIEPGTYPANVGIYAPINGKRKLQQNLKVSLSPDREIDCFEFFPTQEETLSGARFSDVFNPLWNVFKAKEEMKIGYMLYFKLNNELEYSHTILKPDDTMVFKYYLETYLYDDVHQTKGVRYSHLLPSEMKENTLCTSIKLVGGEWCKDIVKIRLSTFLYMDENDFDPVSREYTGPLKYEMEITPK